LKSVLFEGAVILSDYTIPV